MNQYEERRKLLESEQKLEFDMFNESWDEKFYEMNTKFEEMQKNLKEQHEKELSEEINKFNETYPQHPKPTPEILQLNKSLEVLANMREYDNVFIKVTKMLILFNASWLI